MLLLMVDTDTDGAGALLESLVAQIVEERPHARIRRMTVIDDFIERGTAKHPASWARMLLADSVVVRIEEDLELFTRRTIPGVELKKERLEKPARMT